jgi:hypothetical protein
LINSILIYSCLLAILFNANTALAKPQIFIEPYVGIAKIELDIDSSGIGTLKEVANGFFVGSKAGLTFAKTFFIGGDYHTSGPFKFGKLFNEAEWTQKMMGIGMGLDYKVIRFWAGYYPKNQFDDSTGPTYTGSAIKVGFGLLAAQKLRANLDLVFFNTNKAEENGMSSEIKGLKVVSTHVSISIPLEF